MNYLAHSFLSGNNEELLVGNFIADSVRGNQLQLYPEQVARGIRLHRLIDSFTDNHPVVAISKERLRPGYRKYAGVITDIYFDHFLAINFEHYSVLALPAFSRNVYTLVQKYEALLPERVRYFLPYMIEQNWLLNYAHLPGIRQALTGLSRRTAFASNMETAADELRQNYALYQAEFRRFFPELQDFVKSQLKD